MAQPTTVRECKSSTAARNSQPLRARIWVISHARARSVRNCSGLARQHVGRDGQAVPAVGGVNEFALLNRPQFIGLHQGPYPVPSPAHALLLQGSTQPAAAAGPTLRPWPSII